MESCQPQDLPVLTDGRRGHAVAARARRALADDDRLHLHFALGKALEDAGQYAGSFAHYADGNRIRRAGIVYDAEATAEFVRRSRALFTAEFVAHAADGAARPTIRSLSSACPRSGSTLVEQILASHAAVEGAEELPEVAGIARIARRRRGPLSRGAGQAGRQRASLARRATT